MTFATQRRREIDAQARTANSAADLGGPEGAAGCVAVVNDTACSVDESLIRESIQQAMKRAGVLSFDVSVAIVGDDAIQRLNAQFLGHDYPTDALSFLLSDDESKLAGELIVSADTAVRSAADAGWSAQAELLLYVVHGALHLVGFDDATPPKAAAMRKEELKILESIGVAASKTDERWRNDDLLIDIRRSEA